MTYEIEMAGTTMEEKNAALRAAVAERFSCCDGTTTTCSDVGYDEQHPVLADPDDESDDVADPLHERSEHPSSQRFVELLEEMLELHCSKSHDYGSEDDPLANIRDSAAAVGVEPWRGCLLRMMDKVQRLKTYCLRGTLANEGVRDTLLDLASYCLIGVILHDEDTDTDTDTDADTDTDTDTADR